MADTEARGLRQIARAWCWSLSGLRAAFRHEASFRLEVYLAIVLLPLGLWLGNGPVEKILLVGVLVFVLVVELLNSAVETVVDRIGPEHHELSGRAKDIGSGAVLLAMGLVLFTWGMLLLPRLFGGGID